MNLGILGRTSRRRQPLGLIEPTGQTWNTDTYNKCIGPKFQECSSKYSGQQLTDCLDAMQLECIAIALNQLQAQTKVSAYPWLVYSADTKTLQAKVNTELTKLGYRAIGTDGKLGSETCGALRLLYQTTGGEWMTLYGGNCKGYIDPTKIDQPPEPPPPAPPPAEPKPPEAVVPPGYEPTVKPKMTTASAMMVGGILAAVMGGGYYYAKKKGWIKK